MTCSELNALSGQTDQTKRSARPQFVASEGMSIKHEAATEWMHGMTQVAPLPPAISLPEQSASAEVLRNRIYQVSGVSVLLG